MLLQSLLKRRSPTTARHAFRWRGDGVSRIEGLSDTVFGFAITLVAVSLEIPRTAPELLHNAVGFIPFVASFAILFFFWRTQFEFFRRYGLEDETTLWLTGMLLVFVLFLIYPLKFLLSVFSEAMVTGDVAKDRLRLDQLPAVLGLYATGFGGVSLAFALLFRHARGLRMQLALTELEAFETDALRRRWTYSAAVAGVLLAWCAVLMSIPEHFRRRDGVFDLVFRAGSALVMVIALSQFRLRRSVDRERRALVERMERETASPSAALD